MIISLRKTLRTSRGEKIPQVLSIIIRNIVQGYIYIIYLMKEHL